jgi:hypothetical protein
MNMYSTGNREQDELLRLLRQGLITPEQARDVGQDYGSLSIADFANLGAFSPETQRGSGRAAVRDAELQQRANATPIEDAIVRGTSRGGRAIGSKPGLLDVGMTQKQGRVGRGRNEALTFGGRQTVEQGLGGSLGAFPGEKDEPEYRERLGDADPIAKRTFEKQDMESSLRDLVAGMDTTQRRSTDPRAQLSTERAEEGEISPVSEGVEVGLLSRIGKAITDNPELAASGAQLLGGLISNAAQNRAQRRADRTNRERTGRANLISALTGGRVRPDVERAQADTGGFMSLDTLGKALQGGGAAYKGELARQVEEAERERKAGLDERAASVAEQRAETQEQSRIDTDAYRDRLLTLQERGLRADYLKSLQSGQPKETPDKQTRNEYKAMSRILRQVDNVENLLRDTDFFQAGSGLKLLQIAGLDEGLPQFMGGEKTRELKAAVNNLVQTLGEGLSGVLSDRDIEFLRQQAIKETDSLDTAMLKAQQIRNRLSQNIRENFEIDSQYFNMEPYRDLVDLVEASGEQGEGSFISDLSGASLNLD